MRTLRSRSTDDASATARLLEMEVFPSVWVSSFPARVSATVGVVVVVLMYQSQTWIVDWENGYGQAGQGQ